MDVKLILPPNKTYLTNENKKKVIQESKGIRQWAINSCTSPMIIHKITSSVD